jgi:hypothetical protein
MTDEHTTMNQEATKSPIKTLPAKYEKFLLFGYWFYHQVKDSNKDDIPESLHLFDTPERQMEYMDHFLEDYKLIKKDWKTKMREKDKEQKQKEKAAMKAAAPPKEKMKRGRKKKEIIDTRTPEEKLIDEIVRKAQQDYE